MHSCAERAGRAGQREACLELVFGKRGLLPPRPILGSPVRCGHGGQEHVTRQWQPLFPYQLYELKCAPGANTVRYHLPQAPPW